MNGLFDRTAYFFASLTEGQVLILAIFGLLIFTIALIIGWLIQRQATETFRKQADLLRADHDVLVTQRAKLQEQHNASSQQLKAATAARVTAEQEAQKLTGELAYCVQTIETLEQQADKSAATNQTLSAAVESLNDQVIGLKTRNESLLFEHDREDIPFQVIPQAGDDEYDWGDSGADAGAEIGAQEAMPLTDTSKQDAPALQPSDGPEGEGEEEASDTERRLAYLEDRLAGLTEQREFTERLAARATSLYTVQQLETTPEVDERGEPVVIRADGTEPGVRYGRAGAAEVIIRANPSLQTPLLHEEDEARDDLTAINNIGPFLQKQLNGADVHRYEQIANWTEADITTYTELIGYLPGAIKRDDWVGQARALTGTPAETSPKEEWTDNAEDIAGQDVSASSDSVTPIEFEVPRGDNSERSSTGETEAPALPSEPAPASVQKNEPGPDNPLDDDNLQIVEGIGPRISQLLKDAGVGTVGQLASSSTEKIQEILDAAGGSFRFHDPHSWVAQAVLASTGELEKLLEWQQELKGGL